MAEAYQKIKEYVDSLYIIDTHEHLMGHEQRIPKWDVFTEYLQHYFSSDLKSAGLPKKDFNRLMDTGAPIAERWRLVEPYWNAARHTGYGRALDIACRDIYGLQRIDGDTIEELNKRFTEGYGSGRYEKILKEKSKIIVSLLDSDLNCDRRYFTSVFRLEHFIMPGSFDSIRGVEEGYDIKIRRLEDWLEACRAAIDDAIKRGAAAFKTGMAYDRTLYVERATFHDAEAAFNGFFEALRIPVWESHQICAPKCFQDYMIHFIMGELEKRGVTAQIHTGLQEGSGNLISDSNPALLSGLFLAYPGLKFDVFHMGYPYQHELSALAKMFPNVYIDMCWGHIISPVAAQNALIEWLDAVPANKISAFGGDYSLVDGVYGHQAIARENVSISLAAKVQAGVFDVDEAKHIAKMLFLDNPVKLFGLEEAAKLYL